MKIRNLKLDFGPMLLKLAEAKDLLRFKELKKLRIGYYKNKNNNKIKNN